MDELARIVKEKQPKSTQELIQSCLKAFQDVSNEISWENVQSIQNFYSKYKILNKF